MRRRGRPIRPPDRQPCERGQTLVEFSLAIMLFLFLLIGTIDLGRAAYSLNGVAEAAREVARATSLHPGSGGLGTSAETAEAVAVHKGMVPGLEDPVFSCVAIDGTVLSGECLAGSWVRVQISVTYVPVMPVAQILGPVTLSSTSSAEIQ